MGPKDLRCTSQLGHGLFRRNLHDSENEETATIDLRRARWIDPVGLVALSVFMERQSDLGRQIALLGPTDAAVGNYASRMNLGLIVEMHGGRHDLPQVRHRDLSSELLELQTFDSEDAATALAGLIFDKTVNQSLEVARSLHQSISELGVNVPNHSGRDVGYAAAQSTYGGKLIKFAVGDAGIGLLGSLGAYTDSEMGAMRLVMDGGVSRTGLQGRGTGIRSTRDNITRVGGTLTAESGRVLCRQAPDGEPIFSSHSESVPGVLMQGLLDFR